ncbi:MAG: ATP-binding protein [Desulfobacteraceae bacterium]|nr:ATP-binding protein [Desulfobacteraceae bacterium]
MKLVHKIILGNVLAIMFIAVVYAFSYQKLDLLLNKLNFVEIAEGLNANLLKMRLSEKNYFLYKDKSDLPLIHEDLNKSAQAIDDERENLKRAIGKEKIAQLESNLKKYEQEVAALEKSGEFTKEMAESLRETGRQLREQSASLIQLEREAVNRIIVASRRALFSFFCFVLAIAATTSYLFFSKMFRSLRRIEKVATAISKGNFNKIGGKIPNDELGSVMTAINSMSEELGSRLEQLIQSRKLASMGVLTAGVAHELGNPLNNISMVAQNYLALYDDLSPEDRLDYMQTVLDQTERIRRVVQNLLDFSKPKKTDFQMVDMNQLAKESLKLVQNMFDVTCIESKLELEPTLPPVFIDRHKIEEVFVNLLTNAVHAMSTCGGAVYIRTRLEEKGDSVVIEVEDTGEGISAEFLPHIFDPFFSTKGTEGTGLGLSISYGIIKNHNGKIDVKSQIGKGTTFTIQLPAHRQEEI